MEVLKELIAEAKRRQLRPEQREEAKLREELATKLEEFSRREARSSLLKFTKFTCQELRLKQNMPPGYAANWHHKLLADALDRVAVGKCKRLMVFMPPQHGKSELVSKRFPAYMLGRNPSLRLIQASHTYDLAATMNEDVKKIITDHYTERKYYAELFPETQIIKLNERRTVRAKRKEDYFEIPGKGGSLRSAGVGNSIAGNPADGAIIDDPFGKREDADSPTIRQKVWEWYANDLYTRLSRDAWIVLTHTRWHRDDLAGRLLRKMAERKADQWEILCYPAIREDQVVAPNDPRGPGEALWPAHKTIDDLEVIRQQDAKAYAALYQQNPSDATNAEWSPELFPEGIWVKQEEWPESFDTRVVAVDPSKGKSDKQGDYCAIVFMGIVNGLVYVDAIVERIPLKEIVRRTMAFCAKHRPTIVGIEGVAFQEMLVHEFERQCGDAFGTEWPVVSMIDNTPKNTRIQRLSGIVANRHIRFAQGSPGCRIGVEQMIDFPFADHDDFPDCLELAVRVTRQSKVGRT